MNLTITITAFDEDLGAQIMRRCSTKLKGVGSYHDLTETLAAATADLLCTQANRQIAEEDPGLEDVELRAVRCKVLILQNLEAYMKRLNAATVSILTNESVVGIRVLGGDFIPDKMKKPIPDLDKN